EYVLMGEGADARQRLNLQVASGDMLDVYGHWIYDVGQVLQWAEDGMVLHLDELIDEYAPNIKGLLDHYGGAMAVLKDTGSGKYVFTPGMTASWETVHGIPAINKAWLDRLGLDVPRDADELLDVLRAFRDHDADGDGNPNNEIPTLFRLANTHWWGGQRFAGFIASFYFGIHATTPGYVTEDGRLDYFWRHPRAQEFLQYLATLYHEGLMPADSLSVDNSSYDSRIRGGNIGLVNAWTTHRILGGDHSYDQYVWLVPDHDEPAMYHRVHTDHAFRTGMFLSARTRNPEVTMRWVDTLYSKEPGMRISRGPIEWLDDAKTQWRNVPPPDGITGTDWVMNHFTVNNFFSNFELPGVTQLPDDDDLAGIEFMAYHKMIAERGLIPETTAPRFFWPITVEESERHSAIYEEVRAYHESEVAKMIFDNDVSDARWNRFQQDMKRLGIEDMLDIMNVVMQRAIGLGFEPEVRKTAWYRAALEIPYDYQQFLELGTR
ncbi:MAG: extracellular solute-binding protein, partial [Spirochaetaceae bacterium]